MPTELHWDNAEQTILMTTFSGDISVDEFLATYDKLADMIIPLDHTVFIIADFREVTRLPMGILAASGSTSRKTAPNIGGLAIVGSNTVLRTIITVWSKLYRQMQMFVTIEEAYAWVSAQQS